MNVITWMPGIVLAPSDLTPDIVDAIKDALETEHVIALTCWAEARSRLEPGRGWVPNPPAAFLDILNVIDNRAKDPRWSPLGRKGICLQHRQFSCWDSLDGADNFHALLAHAQRLLAGELPEQRLLDALAMAHACTAGGIHDELRNSTHYYASSMPAPPAWSQPPAIFIVERYGARFFASVR